MPAVPGMTSYAREGLERVRDALAPELDVLVSRVCHQLHGAEPVQSMLAVVLVLGHMRPHVAVMLSEYLAVCQSLKPGEPMPDCQAASLLESWRARGLLQGDALGPMTAPGTLLA